MKSYFFILNSYGCYFSRITCYLGIPLNTKHRRTVSTIYQNLFLILRWSQENNSLSVEYMMSLMMVTTRSAALSPLNQAHLCTIDKWYLLLLCNPRCHSQELYVVDLKTSNKFRFDFCEIADVSNSLCGNKTGSMLSE